MPTLHSVNDSLKKIFSFLENDYVKGVLLALIILYGSYSAPKLPICITNLLNNKIITFLMIFFVIYIVKPDPIIVLLLSVVIFIFLLMISNVESSSNEPMIEVDHDPSIKLPKFNLPQELKQEFIQERKVKERDTKKIDEILRVNELRKLEEDISQIEKLKKNTESEDKINMVIGEVQKIEYDTGKKPNGNQIKKICKNVNDNCMFSDHSLAELNEVNHTETKKELDGVYSSLNGTDAFATLY